MAKWSVVKNSYNEGNRITTSDDPTWSIVDNLGHEPVTSTHTPCGYWPGQITTRKEYSYIVALFNNSPQLVGRIDYNTGVIDPLSGYVTGTHSSPGLFPFVYKGKLYISATDQAGWESVFEYDLDARVTTRVLPFMRGSLQSSLLYRVGGMVYGTGASDNYGGADYRERIHEIDLEAFTVTGRMTGVSYSYGPVINFLIRGNLMFLVTWSRVVVFDFKSFTPISNLSYTGQDDGVCAVFNNEKTECIIARNWYTPCLIKVSLTNPPVILATKDTDWLPSTARGMVIDNANNVYVSDKFYMKIHRFNTTLWDTPVVYTYDNTYNWTFTCLQYVGEDLWCCFNYTWLDVYRKIIRIKIATMEIDHVISLPNPPFADSLHSVVVY